MLGLLGEGKMWSPSTGLDDANVVLEKNGLKPLNLKPKEGLALINGTQMITALGAYRFLFDNSKKKKKYSNKILFIFLTKTLGADAIERAKYLCLQADIISALTVEVLKGNVAQFDPDIHKARPHTGQIEVI
jgi:histidine ammonia-lyase